MKARNKPEVDAQEDATTSALFGGETRVSTRVRRVDGPKVASLVQIYGPNLGQRHILDKPAITIGRDESCNIVLDNDKVSRTHARLRVRERGIEFEDMKSTNGSLVNDREVKRIVLKSGDIIKIGSVMLKFLPEGSAEALYHEEIYRLTINDGLTDIPNRRYFDEFLDREFARARRYERPLSLMLFDVDHFKKINDEFGHLAGDYVLRKLAGTVQKIVRREELLARYGGEEFGVVLIETDIDKAARFGEKIRSTIERAEFTFDAHPIKVTASIGVADLDASMSRESFVHSADQALYRAKQKGRNRLVRFDSAI